MKEMKEKERKEKEKYIKSNLRKKLNGTKIIHK